MSKNFFIMKGNMNMINKSFHEEYCEIACEEGKKNSNRITFDDKLVIGVYALFLSAFSFVVWYGIL